MTDKQLDRLVAACSGGDAKAFDEIKAHFEPEIYQFALDLTLNETEAKKITAETFRSLGNKTAKLTTLVNVKAFLYITTRNKSFAYTKTEN